MRVFTVIQTPCFPASKMRASFSLCTYQDWVLLGLVCESRDVFKSFWSFDLPDLLTSLVWKNTVVHRNTIIHNKNSFSLSFMSQFQSIYKWYLPSCFVTYVFMCTFVLVLKKYIVIFFQVVYHNKKPCHQQN